MSSVSGPVLAIVVPFFGTALLLSCTFTCCMYRRAARSYAELSDRIMALEARPSLQPAAAPQQATVVPIYNVPTYAGVAQYRPAVVPYYTPVATAPPAQGVQQGGPRSVNL